MSMRIAMRLFLLLLFASEIHSAPPTHVTVKTANAGYLTGITKDVNVVGTIYRVANFLGIPYAQPPVGRLRFRRPLPLPPFKGHRKVQQFGNRCVEWFTPPGSITSEDCLYLNVVVPDVMHLESLAVMVYVHGGGFRTGSSSEYDVDLLASLGSTIIVTVNYRLTAFGFLSTGNDAAEGNFGLWDQHMAIRWVYDNIGAFGGDTGRITIFGESAGAASVIFQGMYPGNKGLFQRIIAQSGTMTPVGTSKQNPKEGVDRLARSTGCYNESTTVMVECLRFLPLSRLRYQFIRQGGDFSGPVKDNLFVACEPGDLLNLTLTSDSYEAARDMFASVDLIMGFNAKEGGLIMAFGMYGDSETFLPNSTYFADVLVPAARNSVYGDTLDTTTSRAVENHIVNEYTDDDDPENPYRIRDLFINMNSDALFIAPIQQSLNLHASLSSKTTYLYYFTPDVLFHTLPTPSWLGGANHADDLAYIIPSLDYPFDSQHQELAVTMVTMWTNFAKTGNPNQPNDASFLWEQYSMARNAYLEFTLNMTAGSMKQGFPQSKADVWNTDLPAIVAAEPEYCDYVYYTAGTEKPYTGVKLIVSALLLHLLQA